LEMGGGLTFSSGPAWTAISASQIVRIIAVSHSAQLLFELCIEIRILIILI
jgi:hypothetical protein